MDKTFRYRLRILAVIALSMFAALTARLWFLQVLSGEEAAAVAETNILREIRVPALRGNILDVEGRTLVGNRLTTMVTINRRELEEAELTEDERLEMLTELAIEVNRSGLLLKVKDIESALSDPSFTRYDDIPIATDVDEELLIYFGERPDKFPGVEVVDSTVRAYLYGDLAGHVLGWVGPINDREYETRRPPPNKGYGIRDEIGKAGIELMFEDDLRGVAGRRVVEVDRLGQIVREREDLFVAPIPGDDVYLTIDIDLQYLLEQQLERTIFSQREVEPEKKEDEEEDPLPYDVPGGASVILDPRNGDVLAIASYPKFDPNDSIGGFSREQWESLNDPLNDLPMFNRAVQGEYAPGSTFKLFTAHAAWHENVFGVGLVKDADELWDDPGYYRLQSCVGATNASASAGAGGCMFRNANDAPYPQIDLVRAITVSSDVYFYTIGESIYINPLHNETGIQDAAAEYGMGAESGIALPYEQAGFLPTPQNRQERHENNPIAFPNSEWYPGDNVNTSIGQGDVLVTPLQLANAYATFANNGTLRSPNIALRVETQTGELVREFGERVLGEVEIDPEFRTRALEGLLGVTTDEDGTGYDAFNSRNFDGAFFPLSDSPVAGKTGTAEVRGKADTALFAAFGPVEEPAYVMVTILEEAGFGSRSAAPLVARVLKQIATNSVEDAPTASISYARSAALPLCLEWLEWLSTDRLSNVGSGNSNSETGPVLEANGEVRVRGEVINCEELLSDNGITVSAQ
ncbi:MAG: penicillin-binding protein 2 [Actinobacteria bacterium]|nr:penicillin-binding protein 2 [Actinomycetota bacterium]